MFVSIQPKPKKGLVADFRAIDKDIIVSTVSIQPKPKKGLVEEYYNSLSIADLIVSIQPKPKKGLVVKLVKKKLFATVCFNPAEAEEGFSRL